MEFKEGLPATELAAPPAPEVGAEALINYTATQLFVHKRVGEDVIDDLKAKGLDHESAAHVVYTLEEQMRAAKRKKANKDMLFGALWCVGGIVATAASIGFIFWGAIVFGAIQFFRGVAAAADN